ncbi:hypothetical protein LWI28_009703 [Acer negundo]|uniref:Retrotransposon gag domain-containing protein n=1 Tax=Acer negundo TaxID=4023 RepID=A0AAD5P6W4_ACENE|nr:hypothetical protein LWI28_009703 [Acer negundo]
MSRIVGLNTTFEIWDKLGRNFSLANNARLLDLEQSLQDVSKDGMSVQEYINKVKGLTDSLAALGESVPEAKQVRFFLRGLGSEYDSFVTSITNRSDQPSLEVVHSLLMTHENRMEKRNSTNKLNLFQANLAAYNKRFQGYQ